MRHSCQDRILLVRPHLTLRRITTLSVRLLLICTYFEAIGLFIRPVWARIERELQNLGTLVVARRINPYLYRPHVREVNLALHQLLLPARVRTSDVRTERM